MCKIILEVEYFIKSMIYQMLKFFKRIAYFIPRWSENLYFDLKVPKNTGKLGTGQKVWGRGWAGAFGNVVDKKHMAHPLPSAQKWLTHP